MRSGPREPRPRPWEQGLYRPGQASSRASGARASAPHGAASGVVTCPPAELVSGLGSLVWPWPQLCLPGACLRETVLVLISGLEPGSGPGFRSGGRGQRADGLGLTPALATARLPAGLALAVSSHPRADGSPSIRHQGAPGGRGLARGLVSLGGPAGPGQGLQVTLLPGPLHTPQCHSGRPYTCSGPAGSLSPCCSLRMRTLSSCAMQPQGGVTPRCLEHGSRWTHRTAQGHPVHVLL